MTENPAMASFINAADAAYARQHLARNWSKDFFSRRKTKSIKKTIPCFTRVRLFLERGLKTGGPVDYNHADDIADVTVDVMILKFSRKNHDVFIEKYIAVVVEDCENIFRRGQEIRLLENEELLLAGKFWRIFSSENE